MTFYSNPDSIISREAATPQRTMTQPDAETFQIILGPSIVDLEDCELTPGWYWWACFPNCSPDGPPFGPFETEELAIADARSRERYGR